MNNMIQLIQLTSELNNSVASAINNRPYFENMLDCTCLNDRNNEEFDNFWKSSGSCCDNLRLTIWIIFNVIFFLLVFILCVKIRFERKQMMEDLENFEQVGDVERSDFESSIGLDQKGLIEEENK